MCGWRGGGRAGEWRGGLASGRADVLPLSLSPSSIHLTFTLTTSDRLRSRLHHAMKLIDWPKPIASTESGRLALRQAHRIHRVSGLGGGLQALPPLQQQQQQQSYTTTTTAAGRKLPSVVVVPGSTPSWEDRLVQFRDAFADAILMDSVE